MTTTVAVKGTKAVQDAEHGAENDARKQAMLQVKNLHKHFGGVVVVNDCSFAIRTGTVTGMVGPNGAGKQTMVKTITGGWKTDHGNNIYAGNALEGYSHENK